MSRGGGLALLMLLGAPVIAQERALQGQISDYFGNEVRTEGGQRILIQANRTWSYLADAVEVIDIDGNRYRTIAIGDQVWMAENLRVKRFANGDAIPARPDLKNWWAAKGPAMAFLGNDDQSIYGGYYNWYAVADSRGICPAGWRVPTGADFNGTSDTYGMQIDLRRSLAKLPRSEALGRFGAARHLTSTAVKWPDNMVGDDLLGFAALPAGGRAMGNGYDFTQVGNTAYFYTSEIAGNDPFFFSVSGIYPQAQVRNYVGENPRDSRVFGLSVRCVLANPITKMSFERIPRP